MPTSEIFIEGTAFDPRQSAVLEAGLRLRSRLAELTAPRSADLIDLCLYDVRPHLVAVDRLLRDTPTSQKPLADVLHVGAATLKRAIDELSAAEPDDAVDISLRIAGALDLQLRIEELALPALAAEAEQPVTSADSTNNEPAVIDVRRIARGGRHPRVLARYERLAPGETFILVHSHDPKPLRSEFEALHRGKFSWEYLTAGPDEWRVRIGHVAEVP